MWKIIFSQSFTFSISGHTLYYDLLWDFRQEGGRLYNIFIFYSMKVFKANAYIRLRQACVCQGYGTYLTVKASWPLVITKPNLRQGKALFYL